MASYSISQRSRWILKILTEPGIDYHSSIFPVRLGHYVVPGVPEPNYSMSWISMRTFYSWNYALIILAMAKLLDVTR